MNIPDFATIFPYLVSVLFVLALITFITALQQLWRGRVEEGDYMVRRRADRRGRVLFLISIVLFVLVVTISVFASLTLIASGGNLFDQGAGTQVAEELTPSPISVSTPPVGFTPQFVEQTEPAATPTEPPTETPVPVTATDAPVSTPTTPTAAPIVYVTSADDRISEDERPVEPRALFDPSMRRIYLFIDFENTRNGMNWTRELYRDDAFIGSSSVEWDYGSNGSNYFFINQPDGFIPGEYEVRLFLDDQEVDRFSFNVTDDTPAD